MSDIIRDLQLPRCLRPHPGLPLAPARPPPLCPPTPCAGPRGRCKPGRRPPAPNLSRQPPGPPRGLHARLDSGPAGSATGDWPAPALPASYLPG